MANSTTPQRQESDRHQKKTWLTALISRPEIGPIGVMLLLFGMLGYFSIPLVKCLGTLFLERVLML
jgi:simple sugar transport system permease protein